MNTEVTSPLPPPIDLIRRLRLAGRAAEARSLMSTLIAAPSADLFVGQIGVDLNYLGMTAQAVPFLLRGLSQPVSPLVQYQLAEELSMCLYILGKYHEANALHRVNRDRARGEMFLNVLFRGEQRWIENLAPKLLGIDEPVAGLSILLIVEGGFGDFVMFSRYVDNLLRDGAREIVIEVMDEWRQVIRLRENVTLARPFPEERLAHAQRCDRIATVFHLFPRYQRSPYFPRVDPAALIELNDTCPLPSAIEPLLRTGDARPKVGLIWRSGSGVRHEPYRSMKLAQLSTVLQNEACAFYSLQVGGTQAQTDEERALMQAHGVIDLGPHLRTFGDAGRVMDALDLLICVDTGPAHLAGALNRPVWVLLAQSADCRWYDDQRYTPWYEAMRLYRQEQLGEWAKPLAELNADLKAFAASRSIKTPAVQTI